MVECEWKRRGKAILDFSHKGLSPLFVIRRSQTSDIPAILIPCVFFFVLFWASIVSKRTLVVHSLVRCSLYIVIHFAVHTIYRVIIKAKDTSNEENNAEMQSRYLLNFKGFTGESGP